MPGKRLGLLALAVFLTRAPFVPPTLEDYDSVNFALALRDYDPYAHQPHPPGFPVYVALAVLMNAVVPEPSRALGLLSALAQALAVPAAFAVFTYLAPSSRQAWLATLLLFACPVLWFNGARPMSDSVGLLFALGAQALLLRHLATGRGLVAGSLVAALAVGVRLQTALLTGPLWVVAALRRGPLTRAVAALVAGGTLWLVPLLVASGGPSRYIAAFHSTMAVALDVEPLFTRFSLNLAVRAARYVLLSPAIEPVLGGAVLGLAVLGAWHLGRGHRPSLALALLCFGPYLVAHALLQQVEATRYTMPYLPLGSLLAAAGIAWLAARTGAPRPGVIENGLTALLVTAAATLTVPALWVFGSVESPPGAALSAVRGMVEGTRARAFALVSHYTLQRYLRALPRDLEILKSGPNQALSTLRRYWVGGGAKPALFLASPRRTDLASMDARVQHRLGQWEWPLHIDRFMTGARPARAELLRIEKPAWIAGPGWLLSLEAGLPHEVADRPERTAYLRALGEPAFLLLAGEPAGQTADCVLDVDYDGMGLASIPCGRPFHQGLRLGPSKAEGYVRLRARPHGASGSAVAPMFLRGLDYGPAREGGWAHGAGWYYPERDERAVAFRWTSARAQSVAYVPQGGASVIIEGVAPVGYVGSGGRIRLLEDGSELAQSVVKQPGFRLEARLPGGQAFREVVIETDRTFVPDRLQHNGDRRQLGVRIYRFELSASP